MRVALPASKVKGLLATLNQASFAAVHELVGFGGLSCKHQGITRRQKQCFFDLTKGEIGND